MSVLPAGAPAKKRPYKFIIGLAAFWGIVLAVTSPGSPLWYYPFMGLLAATGTMIVVVVMLWIFGATGFMIAATVIIGSVLWVTLGPVATIALTIAAAYLLWRFRFQIARAAGVQVPVAATSAETSSAAASSQDSNSGTSN